MSSKTIVGSAIVPFRIVFLMWLFFTADFVYDISFLTYGIIPRTLVGLVGIASAPVLHGNLQHLLSNTFPLLFLGATLFYFYPHIAKKVFLSSYVLVNILVWIFGRYMIHIGASGLIYGIAAFLIFLGLFRRDMKSLIISLIIALVYGYMIYGLIPQGPKMSWEMHVAGALVGMSNAIYFRKRQ